MIRVLKTLLAVTLLILIAVFGSAAWLGATEPGTRWLLDRLLAWSPVPIQVDGLSGSLVGGLAADNVTVDLPVARIRADDIQVAWRPADMVAARVMLNEVRIRELAIDVLSADEPDNDNNTEEDPLFWLQLPVDIRVSQGRVDKLRIVKAEFEDVELDGAIGWGRLSVRQAEAEIAGINLSFGGRLWGAGPGNLDGDLEWSWPAMGYKGGGSFAGDIDVLSFNHRVNLPDALNLQGEITSLFDRPQLNGVASWNRLTIPGGQPLVSSAGEATILSDFLSARIAAGGLLQYADMQEMPAQIAGTVRFDGVTIDTFQVDAFGGELAGNGELSFAQGFSGRLNVKADDIELVQLLPDYPGRVSFNSKLVFNRPTDIDIAIQQFAGVLYGKSLQGRANVAVRDGNLASVDGNLELGQNRVQADLQLHPALSGSAAIDFAQLSDIWPLVEGNLEAQLNVAGSVEKPRVRVYAQAGAVRYETFAADEARADVSFAFDRELSGTLTVAGIDYAGNDLGRLQVEVTGKPAEHRTQWTLTDGLVETSFITKGGWNGTLLTEQFTDASVQPPELDVWLLADKPELQITADAAHLQPHCWAQGEARLCLGETNVEQDLVESSFKLQRFPLAAFATFLPEDVRVTGLASAEGSLRAGRNGLRGKLEWRQGETVLAYLLDEEELETRLSEVSLSIESNEAAAMLDATIRGPEGLNLSASGSIEQPVGESSALSGQLIGRLPDISLFRPFILRVADISEMKGTGRVDLQVSGTVGDPVFRGGAYLEEGLLQLPATGTTLTDINISATSRGGDELLLNGSLRAGAGQARIGGNIVLTERGNVVAELSIDGQDLDTVRDPRLSLVSSPQIKVRADESGVDVRGRVLIPQAVARIRELPPEAVKRSYDVVVHTDEQSVDYRADEKVVTGDVELVLGDDVKFFGFGLESRLDGSLRLSQQRGGILRGNGTVRIRDGFLTGYGKELRVDRGSLTFTGPLDDPVVNVQVSRDTTYENRRYTIGLRLSGNASNLKTEPFSRPAMSEQDILAFLLLDRPASGSGEDTGVSGALLAMGLGQMVPGDSGKFGLDEISFEGSELEQTAVVAGKRISEDLYIRYVFGLFGQPGQFRIRYRLGQGFSLEATTGGTSQALDLIYIIERE